MSQATKKSMRKEKRNEGSEYPSILGHLAFKPNEQGD
jgi:hypothetical protein